MNKGPRSAGRKDGEVNKPTEEIRTGGQEDIKLKIAPGLVLALDWQTGDFRLAMPGWEPAQALTDAWYGTAGRKPDAVLVHIDRVDATALSRVVEMTAQRYRGLKAHEVPERDRNLPPPRKVSARLRRIFEDSLPQGRDGNATELVQIPA